MGNIRLKTKFTVLLVGLIVVSFAINLAWSVQTQRAQTEGELREKGEVLTQQMAAVWEFMSANQDRLEATAYTENGVYQGLHCAIVGKSIGQLFTAESDYITRFVNFEPRNTGDQPDAFEKEALNAFRADPTLKEYYAFTQYNGAEVFRYSAPMKIEENCLDCHGQPQGEIDVTGYPKEGWQIGDVGGAISIVIPMDAYLANEQNDIFQEAVFFVGLLAACILIIYIALSRLVTKPLSKIQSGVEQIQTGNLEVQLTDTDSSFEVNMLVSEFNQMADELSDIYNNLEEQVEDRTAQLAKANSILENQRTELEEMNEQLRNEIAYKSDFLAMMSHELRTPLTSIVAFTEILNKEGTPQNEKEAETRREIEINSRMLLSLINDILEMSRFDAGRIELNLEPVDIGDVVGLVTKIVQPMIVSNQLEFTCEIDPDVPLITADFEGLRHILENLVGNAIKFTPKEGMVKIQAFYDRERTTVVLKVIDSGIGIAKKNQKRIFERFVQLDSSVSRNYRGTGLGLSLAKEYAEMHGGSISVESRLGKGSAFVVRLPVKASVN